MKTAALCALSLVLVACGTALPPGGYRETAGTPETRSRSFTVISSTPRPSSTPGALPYVTTSIRRISVR